MEHKNISGKEAGAMIRKSSKDLEAKERAEQKYAASNGRPSMPLDSVPANRLPLPKPALDSILATMGELERVQNNLQGQVIMIGQLLAPGKNLTLDRNVLLKEGSLVLSDLDPALDLQSKQRDTSIDPGPDKKFDT